MNTQMSTEEGAGSGVQDRSLLLITGSGASAPLGADRPLPMMAEWSGDIRARVNQINNGLADAMGLAEGLRGDQFEEILGSFLEWEAVLPLIDRFHTFAGLPPGSANGEVLRWMETNKDRAALVVEAVRSSLYDNFNRQKVNSRLAHDAFNRLFSLSPGLGDRLVCATTNYDPSLELVLVAMGFDVRDGFNQPHRWDTPVLQPQGVVRRCRTQSEQPAVAVLHLHGAVGWYRAEDGRIEFHPPDKPYNRSLGVPALLLPDPKKDPSLHAGVDALWFELDDALETSTHVLVMGHSLHDEHLVDHLLGHTWNAKVAATVLPKMTEDAERIGELLPEATIFEFEFGAELQGDIEDLRHWFLR
jgi:hypothetical protein